MEKRLNPDEACRLIAEELGIERSRVRPCFDEFGTRICCLVHESWIQRYATGVPSQDWVATPVSPWSPYEHQLLLQPSHPGPAAPWLRVSIQIVRKPVRKALPATERFSDVLGSGLGDVNYNGSSDLSFAELMQNVGAMLFRHSCDSALETFPLAALSGVSASNVRPSDKNVIEDVLSQAYNLPVVKLFSQAETEAGVEQAGKETDYFDEVKEPSEGPPSLETMKKNVVPFVCALEGKTAYFLVEPYFQHSLHDIVTFSPSVLSSSHVRPLFVIYELLHSLQWYHSHRLAHGALTLEKLKVSKGLWIYLQAPDFVDSVGSDPIPFESQQTDHDDLNRSESELDGIACSTCKSRPELNRDEALASKWTSDDLPCLVQQWVHGEISNYDYLIALNYLAGRRFGDPNYHTVFPWVTDFSLPDGRYRDLTKSKFRLNKGDRQLDVTYKAAWLDNQDGISSATPHHVSDVLSDITYHVYLARRTPKSVLCDHVRTHWVPNEYPSSMERLYHWTPDECIPQFFSDPAIFDSIHADLPDLEVPSWTASPQEFVQWHRRMLESEMVSLNLHHWIDLTFGYKLGGKEAVKAKNVYLHLIDKHQSLSNHGVLQLFTAPHPQKSLQYLPYTSMFVSDGDVQQLVDGKPRAFSTSLEGSHALRLLEESVTSVDSVSDSDLLMKAQTLLSSMKSIENVQDGSGKPAALPGIKEGGSEEEGLKGALFEPISIPCNYNPLNLLEKFEALGKFKSQFGPRTEVVPGSIKCQSKKETDFGRLVQRDMASLGCIIVEMLLAEKVRLATSGLTGRDREKVIAKLCVSNEKLLPRYARAGVRALLKELMTPSEDDTASHDDDDEKLNAWLPPLTPDLLLQPHMGLFPFPSYFSALYEFLAAFYHSGRTLEANSQDAKAQQDWHLLCLRSEDGNAYSVEQVDTAASFLPDLLAKVDEEGIKLLLCHLEPLFTCQKTRLLACTQLFDMLAQALGPKNTVKTFLKCLMSLFDSHTLENYESIARQHFLSQIIVRFGLDGFLKHFISFVVDAVAFKSMMATGSQNGSRLSSFRRTLEAVVPGFSASDRGFSDKERVPMDMDDDLTTDLPSDFLRGASEEQEDELNYSITVDDVENSGGIFGEENTTENLQDLDEVRDSTREKEVSEQVTLMPRGADVDEGDRMLFLQNNLSDDDDDEEGVGDDTGGRRGLVDVGLRTNDANDGNTKDDEVGDDDFGGIVFDNVKSDHSLVDGHGAADGGDDVGNDDSNDSQDKERQCGADTSGPELEPNEKETVLKSDERHDHADGSDWQLRQVGRVGQEVGKEEAGLKQGLTECIQKKTVYSLQIDKVEGEGTKERVEDVGGRDLEEDVGQNNGEDEEQRHSVGENSLEEISGQGDGGPGSQDEEAFDMKEDEEGDDDDDDDDDENGDDEGDEEDNKDHVDQSGDISSQTPVAYEVQTFYNGSETKACLKEEKTEREQNELTPGAISGIAAESIVWLAPRLGPVLTSKYIASQLLTMLPHCYIGHVGCADGNEEKVVNDRNAKWLLFCLGNFCTLYGEAFMLYQYLPYIEKTVKSVQNKVTTRSEAALAGVLSLLKYCIPYLSRDTLQNYCESELMKEVFQPVIRVLSSYTMSFPGGVAARQAICRSYIDVLTVVCLKLERELARENMTAALQQFFSCFELESMRRIADKGESQTTAQRTVESSDGLEGEEEKDATDAEYEDGRKADLEALYSSPVYDELCHTFSAAIAHHAFVPLCGIMGSKYMESALYNHDLIWNLCCSHDAQLSHPTCEDTRTSEDDDDTLPQGDRDGNSEQTFEGALEVNSAPAVHHGEKLEGEKSHEMKKCLKEGFEKLKGKHKPPMWFIGRRLSRQKDVPPKLTPSSSSDQYLRGSWLEHWENQLNLKGKVGNNFNLQQVKLQTFTGHSGAVRSLYVQDSEHFFLSASKDKTVKLWSLSNHGDGTAQSASSWTYYRHSRPVFHVGMVESVRQAVSCDGSLHLWDPVSGRCLGIFEPARNNPVVAMTTLPAPGQCVVAAMAEGTARFLDVRQHSFVQEWKVTTSNLAGTVRDICCSPDGRWIALGFSSGLASVLDIRGGLLRSQRRAHTSDIFQVKAFSNNSFVTSSVDQGLSLWKDDGLRMKILKGHSDPLPSLLVWRDQVISASVGGRVGVHNLQEEQSETSYFSYKLSGEVFRGGVTCLGYLPLNRLLLIGSDTGNISLCS